MKLAHLVRSFVVAFLSLFIACTVMTAAPKDADAGNFEISGAFGWLGNVNSGDHKPQGFHFVVSPGWRFMKYVGIYLDEAFGGLFVAYDVVTYDYWSGAKNETKRISYFAGHTILNVRGFIEPVQNLEVFGKFGIGGFYTASDDAGHKTNGAFGLKLGAGVTYFINSWIGIGGDFDYILAAGDGGNGHYLDLLFHAKFKF